MPELSIRPINSEDMRETASFAVKAHSALFDAPELPRRTDELTRIWSRRGRAEGVFAARDKKGSLAGIIVLRHRDNARTWPHHMRLLHALPYNAVGIELLAVRDDLRRQGVAAALTARAKDYAQNMGCDSLMAAGFGTDAGPFFSALGFENNRGTWELRLQQPASLSLPPLSRPRRLALPLFKPSAFWQRLDSGDVLPLQAGALLIFTGKIPHIWFLGTLDIREAAAEFLGDLSHFLAMVVIGGILILGVSAVARLSVTAVRAMRISLSVMLLSGGLCAAIGLLRTLYWNIFRESLLWTDPYSEALAVLFTIYLFVPVLRSERMRMGMAILVGSATGLLAAYLWFFKMCLL